MKTSLEKMLRLITFRCSSNELLTLTNSDFYLGLAITWLVGIGRYWDHPKANWAQMLGAGSVIYIFVLSLFLWLLYLPLKFPQWNYVRVLSFVSLTSLPALLYAIPVERFMSMDTAAELNAWFLAVVALWRVSLLFWFIRRTGSLGYGATTIVTLLPLTLIVTALAILNLEHVAFSIMGGIREKSSGDTAQSILMLLAAFSTVLFIPLLAGYGWIVNKVRKRK